MLARMSAMSMVPKILAVMSVRFGGGGALLQRGGELPAVVDQRSDEAEKARGAGGRVRAGGGPILLRIGRGRRWNGGGGRNGNERNKNSRRWSAMSR